MPTAYEKENARRATDVSDEKSAVVREILEAVTALGFYVQAGCQELERLSEHEGGRRLSTILRKALTQHERASDAIRRLRDINTRERANPASERFG